MEAPEEKTVGPAPGDGKAKWGLGLGIAGLVVWFLPLVGVPVGIAGVVLSIQGMKSARPGMAGAGLALGILCLVLSVANAAIGAYLGATGQLWFQKH